MLTHVPYPAVMVGQALVDKQACSLVFAVIAGDGNATVSDSPTVVVESVVGGVAAVNVTVDGVPLPRAAIGPGPVPDSVLLHLLPLLSDTFQRYVVQFRAALVPGCQ